MQAGRDETLSIFRTWRDDRVLIRVELRFLRVAAAFPVRVTRVEPDGLWFLSDDTRTELVLPVPADVEFRFLDMQNSQFVKEGLEFERILMMFYPFASDPDETDQVVFAEYKDPTNG